MRANYFYFVVIAIFLVACNNQTKEDMYHAGFKLLESGSVRGAIIYFKNALEKDPNYSQARYHLADAYLKLGQADRAEREFKKVSLQSSSFRDLPLKLAETYLLTSRTELAIQTIENYHLNTNSSSKSLDVLGRAYSLTGNYTKAESVFREAVSLNARDPYPLFHMSKLFIHQNRKEEAHKILLLLVEQHEKFIPAYELLGILELQHNQPTSALSLYRKLYKLDPGDINALYMQGFISLMLDRPADSIEVSSKLFNVFPEDYRTTQLTGLIAYRQGKYEDASVALINSLQVNQQPLTYYFLGLCYFKLGNLELSINQFQKMLDIKPSSTNARLMLARIFLQQKRLNDCIREARYVLTNSEQNSLAYNILGSAHLLLNNYDEAMKNFNRAIEIDPAAVDVYLKKGTSLISMGKTELAEAALLDALAMSPDILNVRFMLATLYARQENYTEAVKSLQEGLNNSPADALIYYALAKIYFEKKDHLAALDSLRKAKHVNPEYTSPALTLASYFLVKADYNKAINEYLDILKSEKSNQKALIGLGLAYELSGRSDEAQSTYSKLLKSGSTEAVLFVSQMYLAEQRIDEALTLIDDALKTNPSYVPLYELKTTILLNTSRTGDALQALELLEKQAVGRGYPRIVGILLKNDQIVRAEEIAENLIIDKPNESYGYLLKSTIYGYVKQYDKAMEIIKQGLALSRNDSGLSLRLGHIQEMKSNVPEAIKIYQDIIKSDPNYYPAVFALGVLYDRMGNKKEAQKYYQKTISLNDHHVSALNNLAYLYADNYGDMHLALNLSLQSYRLAPNQQDVLDTLGFVFLKTGNIDEAIKFLEKAGKFNIYNPSVSYHLALAYVESKQIEKAIAELEKTLEIDDFPKAESSRQLLAKLKNLKRS